MDLDLIARKTPKPEGEAGVYADLASLVALEHKARDFSFLPRQPVHSVLTGRYASRIRGRGLNFEELRRYLPGDDIRAMDWKATARSGKPQLRVYTEERDRPALLVVDQRMSMFFGSTRCMKSVTAAELTALAAWRVLSVGDRAGAVVFNDSELAEIRPQRSRGGVMEILKTVVDFGRRLQVDEDVTENPGMLATALEHAARLATHDFLVCVISDFTGVDDEVARLMTKIAAHNDVIAGHVYDPLEERLPQAGRFVVSDGSRQLEVDTGDAGVRERFAEDFRSRLEEARRYLVRLAVPVLPISTAEGVAEQVRAALGQRPGGAARR